MLFFILGGNLEVRKSSSSFEIQKYKSEIPLRLANVLRQSTSDMAKPASHVPYAARARGRVLLLKRKRLSATDISALTSMKNVAKCDTWCELQNPVNHRVFERKLRPKPLGRGHVCLGITNRVAPALWDAMVSQGGYWPSVRLELATGLNASPHRRTSRKMVVTCTDGRFAQDHAQGFAETVAPSYSSGPGTFPDGRV
ncbi:hypothetical protein RND71_002335 [Anisodus tanguticus]|uniref:Uncharacterized protein n=1 Tax=Anisodus tanguticus TaxID=243964 RepID=A0AAE1SZM3_9SOLA|nr:hypothetical protein RND71_002335 [Anisodus tanguticus]